ncbi:MAG TPA: hypothetical protein VHC70_09570 [Phycisphaerales bacterium]|nr:hypothetical protein [Phycisphaerales bacterium]
MIEHDPVEEQHVPLVNGTYVGASAPIDAAAIGALDPGRGAAQTARGTPPTMHSAAIRNAKRANSARTLEGLR